MEKTREDKALDALESAVNNCSFSPKDFAERTTKLHRYLQNEIFKLAVWIIRVYGSENYGYDLRNEYAHETAKKILDTEII